MQVAEQFKCVNFTHLNITASSLYLIAVPSTPKKARIEVLERASNGENISSCYETPVAFCAQKDLTEKDALAETRLLSSLKSLPSVAFEDKQIVTKG